MNAETSIQENPGATPPNYRALRAVVIILGALILLAFGALVAGLLLGVGPKSPAERASGPYETLLQAPAGTTIKDARLDGDRVILRMETTGGDILIIVDASSGREIGRITVAPKP